METSGATTVENTSTEDSPITSPESTRKEGNDNDKQRKDWKEWKEQREWEEWKQRKDKRRDSNPRLEHSPSSPMVAEPVSVTLPDPPQDESHHTPGEVRTQYVLSGRPTGWAAIDRVIRDYDEEKVRDCKEDIDTLLVFAGLFSAVLTAFLIESYQNLLEDTASDSLSAQRQLVAQTSSYQLQGNLINSTAAHPTPPAPFQPSSVAIRVNVLWFASLLFALTTASFGILVKQWLREYMAVQNPSPQARLRLRHLRYPELSKWKIFEIAAFLPLLLQLSLALFFIGLCDFTASVHSSIGYTTLPIVIAWALCFMTVTILPLFFPRCPYRTTLLKGLVTPFHRIVGRLASLAGHHYITQRWDRISQGFIRMAKERLENDEVSVVQREGKDLEILAAADAIQSNDELLSTAIAEAASQVRLDFQQPDSIERFLRTILANRLIMLPPGDEFLPSLIIDLRTTLLSARAQSAFTDVVLRYCTSQPLEKLIWQSDRFLQSTLVFALMLSMSGYHIKEVPQLRNVLSSDKMTSEIVSVCRMLVWPKSKRSVTVQHPDQANSLLRRYVQVNLLHGLVSVQCCLCRRVEPLKLVNAIVQTTQMSSLEQDEETDRDNISLEFRTARATRWVASWPWTTMPIEVAALTFDFLRWHLGHALDDFNPANNEVNVAAVELLVAIIGALRHILGSTFGESVVHKMLSKSDCEANTLVIAVCHVPSEGVVHLAKEAVIHWRVWDTAGDERMLTLWKSALALQISSPVPESDNFIKTLKLCLFSMCLSVIMRRKPILRTMWTDLFEFFTQRIQEFDQMTLKNSPQMDEIEISGLATSCLESIRQEEILRKYLNSYDVELRQRDCSVGWDSEQKMVAGWRTPPLLSPYSEQLILTLERFALPSWYQPVGIPVWLR